MTGVVMTRQEKESVLERTFKLPTFYDEQWLTIDKLQKGEKVLLIEKTIKGSRPRDGFVEQ